MLIVPTLPQMSHDPFFPKKKKVTKWVSEAPVRYFIFLSNSLKKNNSGTDTCNLFLDKQRHTLKRVSLHEMFSEQVL